MIGMIVRLNVKEGKSAEFERVFTMEAQSVRTNELGNHLYELFKSRIQPPLRHVQPGLFKRAVEAVGPNRVLFATDYPYQYRPEGDARRFVKSLECNDADKAQFAYENWERLIDGNKRCDAGPITSQRC